MTDELLDVSTHFRFGENWAEYSNLVDGRLGAERVMAIDIDQDSVATTRKLLSNEGGDNWRAEQMSVFDLPDRVADRYDVVYSWGVLHHTGAMWRAVESASAMVKPGGLFAVALYERTYLCPVWTQEKRLYRRLPKPGQKLLRGVYLTAWGAGMMVKGHNPWRHLRQSIGRGMSVHHDIHDWLGGYPYESTCPAEVVAFMGDRGFEQVRVSPWRTRLLGIFGTGCSEYVFRRKRGVRARAHAKPKSE